LTPPRCGCERAVDRIDLQRAREEERLVCECLPDNQAIGPGVSSVANLPKALSRQGAARSRQGWTDCRRGRASPAVSFVRRGDVKRVFMQ